VNAGKVTRKATTVEAVNQYACAIFAQTTGLQLTDCANVRHRTRQAT
jgi:hypothetical protein